MVLERKGNDINMAWEMNSDRPIYTQILEKIQTMIICGVYKPGDKLPSVRELASLANVNPNTMQKALQELEDKGLIFTERTNGKFVTNDKKLIQNLKEEYIKNIAKTYFNSMKLIGISKKDALDYLQKFKGE